MIDGSKEVINPLYNIGFIYSGSCKKKKKFLYLPHLGLAALDLTACYSLRATISPLIPFNLELSEDNEMLSIWLLCPILYWLSGVLMFWIEKQFPSLPWHMWKPCPAKHIIQPDPGLGSQRVCGCYATHRPAAESGWQPLSGACWWTVIDLSTILSCHHNVHPGPLILYIFYTLGRISVSAFPKVKKTLILKDTVVDISFVIRSTGLDSFAVLTFIFYQSRVLKHPSH